MPDATFDPDGPADCDALFGLPHTVEEAAVVVVPVPFEATASYRRGTRAAPDAIRKASGQVDLHDSETGSPWRQGIAMEPIDPQVVEWNEQASRDALRVIGATEAEDPEIAAARRRVDAVSERLNAWVRERTESLFARGAIPAILGGDHSVAFGAIEAAAHRHPGLGILQVDAHCDLRPAYEGFTWSHASVFHNVTTRIPQVAAIVQVGVRDLGEREWERANEDDHITTWLQTHVGWLLAGGSAWGRLAHHMVEHLPETVWVSFDIDGLDPALCPHTGAPVPGGLSWQDALVLLRVLAETKRRIVGFDLCEVAPGPDEWDAIVGARLLYKLAGWALHTQETRR
ncbi:MAG: agmatinase family protein [Deltaproteobacteria bacterium]|nr:agmatinase family protein [Deltaproteobacteria bacterium]MBW2253049.1 agmatinase family protein [Deltaproteobacteria bacterium]